MKEKLKADHLVDSVKPKRLGVLGMKVGMLPGPTFGGKRFPLTVIQCEDLQITAIRKNFPHNPLLQSIEVGGGERKLKNTKAAMRGHDLAAGCEFPKRYHGSFKVTDGSEYTLGQAINVADLWEEGQFVDVQGTTHGKGFQGTMKKFGYGGQSASHGTSKTHRSAGSTGGAQDPGKVAKGKRMAGRMGGDTRMTLNLPIWKVDRERNLLFVRGTFAGKQGDIVRVRDAFWKDPSERQKKDMKDKFVASKKPVFEPPLITFR